MSAMVTWQARALGLRAEAPDVQVVDVDDAFDLFHAGANVGQRDAARGAFKQDVQRLADDADAGPENERGDEERKDGVDPVLAGEQECPRRRR